MLNGGLPSGRSVLVSGPCGSGKTILGFHFVKQGCKERQKCVYFTFEQSKEYVMSDAKSAGIDLSTMERSGHLRIVGGQFGSLRNLKQRSQAKFEDMIAEVQDILDEHKPERVVVDSINLFTLLFDNDSDRRASLAALISTLENTNCTSLLICENPERSSRYGWFGFEEFMVDGVISLDRKTYDGEHERSVSIVKMRGSAHSNGIRALRIADSGIIIYPEQEPSSIRVAHNERI